MVLPGPGMSDKEDRCLVCGENREAGASEKPEEFACGKVEPPPEMARFLSSRELDRERLCQRCLAGRVPSPCVGVCRLDDERRHCQGCLRTLDEVRRWSKMGPQERTEVLLRLSTKTL